MLLGIGTFGDTNCLRPGWELPSQVKNENDALYEVMKNHAFMSRSKPKNGLFRWIVQSESPKIFWVFVVVLLWQIGEMRLFSNERKQDRTLKIFPCSLADPELKPYFW